MHGHRGGVQTSVRIRRASRESGIPPERIAAPARKIADAEALSIWWTIGVNQSHRAVRTAQAIINICLITGNIGRPGTGPNSITGQADAMGSRLLSNTTSLFGSYRFTEAAVRWRSSIPKPEPGRWKG
ncbi:MAG: hypothetical protein ACLFQZ_13730 [Spirochaetaceae bacterium]